MAGAVEVLILGQGTKWSGRLTLHVKSVIATQFLLTKLCSWAFKPVEWSGYECKLDSFSKVDAYLLLRRNVVLGPGIGTILAHLQTKMDKG
jgi:hypothetical protein